ncbi:MAG: hypothetical protein K2I49_01105, partial [Ureaplasma sp.]|nr:hypothetical protein [Ureaplasma sp.]
MKIKIKKDKIDDEMFVSFYIPLDLYKKIISERKDYILDLVEKSKNKNKGKSHKAGENYVDNLRNRITLENVRILKLENLLEKELTDEEKDEYELVAIK